MASADNKKQLKIKTGVVKRLHKEVSMYEKEVTDIENKIKQMKEDGKDPYDIKKMGEVLAESVAMVPDTKNRLKKAVQDLDILLENADISEEPEYKAAKEIRDLVTI